MRWAGRRHDDDRPDAISGASPDGLFDAVFAALHDGEQVALGFDRPLTLTVSTRRGTPASAVALLALAAPSAGRPGIAELGRLLADLGTWRPWTTVSTSLRRWRANTSVLVWEAIPADGPGPVAPETAAGSFFQSVPPPPRRQARARLRAPASLRELARPQPEPAAWQAAEQPAAPVVNLAAAAARRAGLSLDEAELARPPLSITVSGR